MTVLTSPPFFPPKLAVAPVREGIPADHLAPGGPSHGVPSTT